MTTQLKQPAEKSHAQSHAAFARAQQVLPGGVNSPVRAYQAVGCEPITMTSGNGCRVTDVDGHDYIDYVLSYGPLILGHCHQKVIDAIKQAASAGTSFGMPTIGETQLAQKVIDAVDSIEMVRFVNSGTEATMSAIRLARGATGKSKMVKCIGCYHGHSDGLLVQAGSGAMTLGVPSSPGVPKEITQLTLLVPFNDLPAMAQTLTQHDDIACIIIEPIAGNMGCIPPAPNYLQGLRTLCDEHDVILIFDEVMTGFRVAWGGAQQLYNIKPDLTCLGKVIGGGLPTAAYGGAANLMKQMAPQGPIYQAGTLSGNPLAMAAGLATLALLEKFGQGNAYDILEKRSDQLATGLRQAAASAGVPLQVTQVGSMIGCFFSDSPVADYQQAAQCNTKSFATFFRHMLDQGIILPPSQFETWFVSTAHHEDDIQQTIDAAERALKKM